MTLDDRLLSRLERVEPDSRLIERLLEASRRNIRDAEILAVSNENRFDAAYKAIMQLAKAVLLSKGYRTLISKPGHHQTMIHSLSKIIGLDRDTMIILEALRKQRNAVDYSGDLVADSVVNECVGHAKNLLVEASTWLSFEHLDRPDRDITHP